MTFSCRNARGFLVAMAFMMRKFNCPRPWLSCRPSRLPIEENGWQGHPAMYKSWSGRVADLRFRTSLKTLSWLGRFPMALPDQLATQAVLLADTRHLEVPAESDRVQGVGHELHPRALCSRPDATGHHDGAITGIPFGVRGTSCRASTRANNKQRRLRRRTENT